MTASAQSCSTVWRRASCARICPSLYLCLCSFCAWIWSANRTARRPHPPPPPLRLRLHPPPLRSHYPPLLIPRQSPCACAMRLCLYRVCLATAWTERARILPRPPITTAPNTSGMNAGGSEPIARANAKTQRLTSSGATKSSSSSAYFFLPPAAARRGRGPACAVAGAALPSDDRRSEPPTFITINQNEGAINSRRAFS